MNAKNHLKDQFNLYWVPTIYWDGGYIVQVGATGTSDNLNTCKARTVADVDLELTAYWLGDASLNILATVKNNEATAYTGYIRVYVTEKVSSMGWSDYSGAPYHFAFLDFAFKENLNMPAGGTWRQYTLWDGNLHDDGYGNTFGSIARDNLMVVASVFEGTPHPAESDPYYFTAPFDAYYADEAAGAEPGPLGIDSFTLPQSGGTVNLFLSAGTENAGRSYLLLGSLNGTTPGTPLPGGLTTIPLNRDWFTDFILDRLNKPVFTDFKGTLDSNGEATASLNAPALPSGWAGKTMHFAYALKNPWDYASNATAIRVVP